MQVKKTFKGNKEIVQEGYEAPCMENSKEYQSPMKKNNTQKLKMAPKFTI